MHAGILAHNHNFGKMVALRGNEIIDVPLKEAVAKQKLVSPDHPLVKIAKSVGTSFGE